MATTSAKFVLIGPYAGQTIHVNGHEFIDGRYEFVGDDKAVVVIKKIFAHYGAFTEEDAEVELRRQDEALQAERDEAERKALAELGRELDGGNLNTLQQGASTEAPVAGASTSGVTLESMLGSDTNDGKPVAPAKPSLGEVIGTLDPENDAHWTSNNLPSLDHLSEATGAKVSRGEVEAIAEGYTRAKARAAKA